MTADDPWLSLGEKFRQIAWGLVFMLCLTAGVGMVALYSAANGSLDPWASRQMVRFAIALALFFIVALIDIRIWLRIAYPFYALTLLLLIGVEVKGEIGMGAQRWIDIGFMQLQPSEVMKIAMVLALARYFHGLSQEDVGRIGALPIPALLVGIPVLLVMRQPDLGTAVMLVLVAAAILFVAGVRLWVFGVTVATALAALPVAWSFLHEYQKRRVLTFLDPESDPLGAGYHILQSKIALGSGGMTGKGFLMGTQSHLNFLPEKQTDFIFTLLAEEWGMIGGLFLLTLYASLLSFAIVIALRSRNQFGRLLGFGLAANLFLYVFINIAMVMGLMPVVGVPLPLISYGGTAMLAVMVGFGLIMSVYIHRDMKLPRQVHLGSW